ncbi:MAG: ParB/RepB/Spo0J family partition protein [Qingshengfaniella sp.]
MADVGVSGGDDVPAVGRAETVLPIEKVFPNPDQPRRLFSAENLQDLANSIREKGIIQPLIVRRSPTEAGTYQIVAGERRWRAAQMAQVHELPVIVRDLDDTEVLEIAIIENIQRADLNAIEEAMGYRQLMDKFGHTQEKLAAALGKSRSHIANFLRLLSLPETVRDLVARGDLSAGHARALIPLDNPEVLARRIVANGLSVRETERLVKEQTAGPKPARSSAPAGAEAKDADTRVLEQDLSAALGLQVRITHRPGQETGTLSIAYRNFEQLDDLCGRLSATRGAGSI